jgi:hypothetical protein
MFEYVAKSFSITSLYIKASTRVVFKALHAFDVRSNIFWQVPSQYIPDKTHRVKRFVHRELERHTIFLASQQTSCLHLLFMMS